MSAADQIERARTLIQLRRPAEAERELRGLLAQEPQHTDGHAFLSLALIEQHQEAEAVQEAQEAVRLGPDRWHTHYFAAQVYNRAGRPDDALAAVRTALDLNPEYAPNWKELARAHLLKGEWSLTAEAGLRGLSLDPQDGGLVSLVALAYVQLGDARQATAAAAHAVRLDPESATAHFVSGRAALRFGEPRRAAESFRETLRLEPGHGPARDLLVRALKQRNPVYRRLGWLRGRFPNGWRLIFLLPVAPFVIAIFVVLALLNWVGWVAEAWTMLRLSRANRLLFEGREAVVAAVCLGLVAAGAVLLGLGIALGHEPLGMAGAAVMALVTPVQEAAHTGSPRRRAILYGWAALLGLAIAVSALVPDPTVLLLSLYAALATVWLATPVRGRLTPAV